MNDKLYKIVRELVDSEITDHEYGACVFCGREENRNGLIPHTDNCLWLKARKTLDEIGVNNGNG